MVEHRKESRPVAEGREALIDFEVAPRRRVEHDEFAFLHELEGLDEGHEVDLCFRRVVEKRIGRGEDGVFARYAPGIEVCEPEGAAEHFRAAPAVEVPVGQRGNDELGVGLAKRLTEGFGNEHFRGMNAGNGARKGVGRHFLSTEVAV